jgi:hypothetical protein
MGRTMAQAVSCRPLTAEVRLRARVNPCVICGGQSGTGTGFSPSSSVFPCQYHSAVALQTHIIWGMHNIKVKGKAVPLYTMEALGGRGGIAPTHSRPRH